MSPSNLIERAISLYGSEAALGKAIGYTQHGIWRARQSGRVSPRMALRIHAATQGKIDCRKLCPDLNVKARLRELHATGLGREA